MLLLDEGRPEKEEAEQASGQQHLACCEKKDRLMHRLLARVGHTDSYATGERQYEKIGPRIES